MPYVQTAAKHFHEISPKSVQESEKSENLTSKEN